ncbi:Zinc finger and SCAN domain-containing protein 4, partial [Oryzias melastigma]
EEEHGHPQRAEAFHLQAVPPKIRDSVTFEKHRLRHQERIHASFCCPLCSKTFKTRTGLKNRQLVHTDARPFVCAVCQKGFKTKYNLRAHEALHATKTFQDAVSLHEQPHVHCVRESVHQEELASAQPPEAHT